MPNLRVPLFLAALAVGATAAAPAEAIHRGTKAPIASYGFMVSLRLGSLRGA